MYIPASFAETDPDRLHAFIERERLNAAHSLMLRNTRVGHTI